MEDLQKLSTEELVKLTRAAMAEVIDRALELGHTRFLTAGDGDNPDNDESPSSDN